MQSVAGEGGVSELEELRRRIARKDDAGAQELARELQAASRSSQPKAEATPALFDRLVDATECLDRTGETEPLSMVSRSLSRASGARMPTAIYSFRRATIGSMWEARRAGA